MTTEMLSISSGNEDRAGILPTLSPTFMPYSSKFFSKKFDVLDLHRHRKNNFHLQGEARVQSLEGVCRIVHLCP